MRKLLLSVACCALATNANAAEFTVTVGSRSADTSGVITAAATDTIKVQFEAGRSYACTAAPRSSVSEFDFSTNIIDPSATRVARKCGNISPVVTTPTATDSGFDDNRLCFTALESGIHTITVETAVGGGEVVRIECLETTLFGGYNTNVNDFNFLELENTTGATITAKVTAKTNSGTTVIDAQEVEIDAGERADVDIHQAAGTDVFGPIIVTHDGPLGALQGRTSLYTGDVSDFNLNGQTPLQSREQSY